MWNYDKHQFTLKEHQVSKNNFLKNEAQYQRLWEKIRARFFLKMEKLNCPRKLINFFPLSSYKTIVPAEFL